MTQSFFDKYIGMKYTEYNEQGHYIGCLLPVYLLYPKAPKRKISPNEFNTLLIFNEFSKVFKHCLKPEKFADIILFRQFGKFHIYVVVNANTSVHINRGKSLEYIHYDINRKDPRVIGVFRWQN